MKNDKKKTSMNFKIPLNFFYFHIPKNPKSQKTECAFIKKK